MVAAARPIPGLGDELGWRALTDRLQEGFVVGDVVRADGQPPDFRHLYVNPAWARLTGLDPAAVLGRPVREALPELEPEWRDAFVRVVETGAAENMTRHAAMLGRTYEVRAFPLDGALFGLLFMEAIERGGDEWRRRADAVERRLTATVSESERTWEITPDLLSVFDAHGRFAQANPAWRRTLGRPPASLVGRAFLDLLHPDDVERTRAEFERITSRDEPTLAFENRYRHADGDYRWLSWVAVPEGDRVYCTARDVTRDKAREARLAERNRIWDASSDLYVVLGLDGLYREVNPAWHTALGHEPDALVGTSFERVLRPDMIDAGRGQFAKVAAGGRVEDFEVALRAADGADRWYSFSAFVEGDRILAIGRDIDERRRAEAELAAAAEALRQSQKLEMIGQLTGGIAHDFNNLLMAMQSSLELLDGVLDTDGAAARALVSDALAGAARGTALTQRLLAFARRQTLVTTAVDVGALVRGMEDLLTHSLGPRIELSIVVAPDTPAAAVDGNQLEMALLNLAVNARDAIDGQGRLRLAVGPQAATGRGPLPKGAYVRLAATDTGRGMDAGTLERAAEPFFTTKPVGSGTGLGLAMIHGLAEQSGGRFLLTSELGVGTTAEILLPSTAAPADVPRAEPADPPPPGPVAKRARRVLVVDDDELVLRGMAGILERLGHAVFRAASGALALQVLAREAPMDVVVTDQMMPGMTGLELAAAVRRDHPGTAVVLATGYSEAADVDDASLDARLLKPFSRARLEAVLASV